LRQCAAEPTLPSDGRVVVVSGDGMMPDSYRAPDAHHLAMPPCGSPLLSRLVVRVHYHFDSNQFGGSDDWSSRCCAAVAASRPGEPIDLR
jgi:hypothetical protein